MPTLEPENVRFECSVLKHRLMQLCCKTLDSCIPLRCSCHVDNSLAEAPRMQSSQKHSLKGILETLKVRTTHTCCKSMDKCTPLRCSCCGGSSLARRLRAARAGSCRCSTAMLSTASDKGSRDFKTDRSTVWASGCVNMRSVT